MKGEMKDIGSRKTPGCSLIEVNGISYEFVVGDQCHPCTLEVCLNLGNVILEFDQSYNYGEFQDKF